MLSPIHALGITPGRSTPAQNGQETVVASLMISSSPLRRGVKDQPAV